MKRKKAKKGRRKRKRKGATSLIGCFEQDQSETTIQNILDQEGKEFFLILDGEIKRVKDPNMLYHVVSIVIFNSLIRSNRTLECGYSSIAASHSCFKVHERSLAVN